MLTYLIPPAISWATLFHVMEEAKGGSLPEMAPVEDYSATEPSLEQVFLAFAREADLASASKGETVEKVTVL